MEIDKVFNSDVDGVADNLFSAVKNSVSEVKAMQQRKAAENVQLVIQALKKIESNLQDKFDGVTTVIEKRVSTIKDGRDGVDGRNGRDGKDGRPGRDGAPGPRGPAGVPGTNGRDGEDGISVTDARIDFDGSLIISLSSGREINVGEVVAPDLAEKIKVITNGGGTSQSVLDSLASLQTQITAISNFGYVNYVGTWNASTNSPTIVSSTGTKGNYYVVSVAGSTNINGQTLWGVGDWIIFNGSVWQKVDGGSTGDFINLNASGVVTFSGGTANRVTYLDGSKVLTTSSALTFDGTNLGIGTASPTTILHAKASGIYGTITIDNSSTSGGGALFAQQNGSTRAIFGVSGAVEGDTSSDAAMYAGSGNGLRFYTNASERMRLTGAGNLGIGTTSPSTRLTIGGYSSANQTPDIQITRSSSGTAIQTGPNITFGDGTTNNTTTLQVTQGRFGVWNYGAGVWNERMSIDASGNVGIGTASPIARLDVAEVNFANISRFSRNITGTNSVGSAARIRTSTTGDMVDGFGTGLVFSIEDNAAVQNDIAFINAVRAGADNTGSLTFSTVSAGTSTERMRLDAAGNLGIGVTSPNFILDVAGDNEAQAEFTRTGTTTGASYARFVNLGGSMYLGVDSSVGGRITNSNTPYAGAITTSNATPLIFGTNNAERARITSGGNFGVGTNDPQATIVAAGSNATVYKAMILRNGNGTDGSSVTIDFETSSGTQGSEAAMAGRIAGLRIGSGTSGALTFSTTNGGTLSERARIDNSGNFLLGTTAGGSDYTQMRIVGANTDTDFTDLTAQRYLGGAASLGIENSSSTTGAFSSIQLAPRSSVGNIQNFAIIAQSTSDTFASNLVFANRTASAVMSERMRIDNAGNLQTRAAVVVYQPAPAAINTTATLTNANIQAQIINTTGTSYTVTMPLGTTLETLVPWSTTDLGYDFTVINTASGTITMAVNTGVTSLGLLTINTNESAQFRIRRTAANTFVLYRMS